MPFNGSGTFTRLYNWTSDANNNLPISSTKFDGEDNDFASGLSNCLTRDGQGKPTTALTWTQPLTLNAAADGTPFSVGRIGGANNPQLQIEVADATGVTLNLTTAQSFVLQTPGGSLTLGGAGNVIIAAPTSGFALNVTGFAGAYTQQITGSATNADSFGTRIQAGTTAGDQALLVQNHAGTATYLSVFGDGHGTLGPTSASGLSWTTGGLITITPTGAGTALEVIGGTTHAITVSTDHTAGHGIEFLDSDASPQSFAVGLGIGSGAATLVIYDVTNGAPRLTLNAAGDFVIPAPSSGNAFSITGVSGSLAALFTGGATTGSSFGVSIAAGTNSSDYGITVTNQAATITYFRTRGDGVILGTDLAPGVFNQFELGFKDTPLNTQSGNYTLVASDRGKVVQTGTTCTYTLPSGVFSGGANVVLRVTAGNTLTVAQGSGVTLSWNGNGGTTGNRTMTGEAIATLLWTTSSAVTISGGGIT